MLELKGTFSLEPPHFGLSLQDLNHAQALLKWEVVKEIHQNINYGKQHLSLLGLPPLLLLTTLQNVGLSWFPMP